MTKENYHPWDINISDFPISGSLRQQLLFTLGFAILAPSGHNSQPWNFSVDKNSIGIFVHRERSLEQSDPGRRQLLVSIGCALENILIVGEYYGFTTETHYFPDQRNQDLAVRVNFERIKDVASNPHDLIFSIPKRRTNRNKYKNELPAASFIKAIENLGNGGILVSVITDKMTRALVADVVNAAQIEVMEEDSFREELSQYVKSNITRSKTGMPGFTLGLPLPVSLIASHLIRRVNMSKQTMRQDDRLLKLYTPVYVVISTKSDDGVSRIRAGQVFERIWLMAEHNKISCAPLAAGVQVGDYYKQIQSILNIKFRPQVFSRMGYCDRLPHHSPRLSLNEVLLNT